MWVASKKQEVSTFHVNLADCSNVTRSGFVFYNVEIILILTDISENSRVRNSKYPRHEKNGGGGGWKLAKAVSIKLQNSGNLREEKASFAVFLAHHSPISHSPAHWWPLKEQPALLVTEQEGTQWTSFSKTCHYLFCPVAPWKTGSEGLPLSCQTRQTQS